MKPIFMKDKAAKPFPTAIFYSENNKDACRGHSLAVGPGGRGKIVFMKEYLDRLLERFDNGRTSRSNTQCG